jgi:hypothetical protein
MRAVKRLALPTLLFVNRIDRLGANPGARQRTTISPLDRPSYLAQLGRHV